MMLALYRTLTTVGGPIIKYYLKRRIVEGKEDPSRFAERKGKSAQRRPKGPLIWLHAASVGESLSMLPLIETLLNADSQLHVLMTTGTVTSAALMADRLPERSFHQYVPVDRAAYIRKFLSHWRPDLALWAESEFWPNLLVETQRRNVPMILVNGRVSPKSFSGWKWFPGVIGQLLKGFTLCLGQTDGDADRLRQLGARNHKCLGNLKFAVPPLPVDTEELIRLEQQISGRPRWLAASTHPGEEEVAGQVHAKIGPRYPGLLTIIVPRHAGRGSDIAERLRAEGFFTAQRSRQEAITPDTEIYIADTMGELGLFFRLSEIAFIGKSLVPLGGQNPLEALQLDCAVIHGPHMANFQKISEEMAKTRSALAVSGGGALAAAVETLLKDGKQRRSLIENGRQYMESHSHVVDRVSHEILSVLKTDSTGNNPHAAA